MSQHGFFREDVPPNHAALDIPRRFADPSVPMSASLDLDLINQLDERIAQVEWYLTGTAKVDDVQTYHRLRTIPGVGPVLALLLLYEMHQAERFERVGLSTKLKGSGPQRRYACPIHRGDGWDRTFSVNRCDNVFQGFDRTCAKKGDVIDLKAALHAMTLRQAALDLV